MDRIIKEQKRNNDVLDLVKFILSFIIVAINTNLFSPYLFPWLRLAVPLFFMISAYFFFLKLNVCSSKEEEKNAYKHFILRNLKLYAFWFAVLSPFIIIQNFSTFENGILNGILNFVLSFFVSNTFSGSGFISALIISVSLVYLLSRKLSNKFMLIIGGVLFILITIRASYFFLFSSTPWVYNIAVTIETYMNAPMLSFPVGIFWVVCGKLFADGFRIRKDKCAIYIGVFSVLLLAEWFFIVTLSGNYDNHSYFMLAPLAFSVMNILLLESEITIKHAVTLRKLSIIMFITHGAAISLLSLVLNRLSVKMPGNTALFLIISVTGLLSGLLILWLERFKCFKWLKYSH